MGPLAHFPVPLDPHTLPTRRRGLAPDNLLTTESRLPIWNHLGRLPPHEIRTHPGFIKSLPTIARSGRFTMYLIIWTKSQRSSVHPDNLTRGAIHLETAQTSHIERQDCYGHSRHQLSRVGKTAIKWEHCKPSKLRHTRSPSVDPTPPLQCDLQRFERRVPPLATFHLKLTITSSYSRSALPCLYPRNHLTLAANVVGTHACNTGTPRIVWNLGYLDPTGFATAFTSYYIGVELGS